MTPVQKAMLHCELARKWSDGFFARPYIRMEWVAACQWHAFSFGPSRQARPGAPWNTNIGAGLWGAVRPVDARLAPTEAERRREARNNP